MKKALPFLIYPALGLLAGWASTAGGSGGMPPAEEERPRRMQETQRSTPLWKSEDFFNAAAHSTKKGTRPATAAITDLTTTWADAEIRNALEAAMKDPDAMIRSNAMAGMLFGEYLRRDRHAAVEWMMAGSPFRRKWCASLIAMEWPADRWREGLDFMQRHRGLCDSPTSAASLATRSLPYVSAQGPEEVCAMMKRMMADGHHTNWCSAARWVPGFDFKALLESGAFRGLEAYKRTVISSWSWRNRDAAFEWVLEHDGPKALTMLAPSRPAARSRVRWFVGKLESLTAEQRQAFMERYASQLVQLGADAKAWMEMAGTPTLRDEILTAAAQGFHLGQRSGVEASLAAVASLPEAEARLRLLETLPRSAVLQDQGLPSMDKEAQKLLRRTLLAWGADPARTDIIVSRYTNLLPPAR